MQLWYVAPGYFHSHVSHWFLIFRSRSCSTGTDLHMNPVIRFTRNIVPIMMTARTTHVLCMCIGLLSLEYMWPSDGTTMLVWNIWSGIVIDAIGLGELVAVSLIISMVPGYCCKWENFCMELYIYGKQLSYFQQNIKPNTTCLQEA